MARPPGEETGRESLIELYLSSLVRIHPSSNNTTDARSLVRCLSSLVR